MTSFQSTRQNFDRSVTAAEKLRVLVACEYSGAVRDAFRGQGCTAFSCDILESEEPGPHFQRDVREVLDLGWDILVAHPPCTHLASSGAQYWPAKQADGRQREAIDFFLALASAKIPYIALENPVGILGTVYRKADQIIQPWQFGDAFNKKTCLWLKNLPPLTPTNIVTPTHNWGSNSYRSGSRKLSSLPSLHWGAKERSRSFSGIAQAMASQWTAHVREALSQERLAA